MNIPYIIDWIIVSAVIVFFVPRYIKRIKKYREYIKLLEIKRCGVVVAKYELFDFLEKRKEELYTPKALESFVELDKLEKEVEAELNDWKKSGKKKYMKQAKEEISKQLDGIPSISLSEKGFYFDPLGINKFVASSSADVQIYMQACSSEIELAFLKTKVVLISFDLKFSGLFPWMKELPEFVEKLESFVGRKIDLLEFKIKKKNFDFEMEIATLKDILNILGIESLKQKYLPQIVVLEQKA